MTPQLPRTTRPIEPTKMQRGELLALVAQQDKIISSLLRELKRLRKLAGPLSEKVSELS